MTPQDRSHDLYPNPPTITALTCTTCPHPDGNHTDTIHGVHWDDTTPENPA